MQKASKRKSLSRPSSLKKKRARSGTQPKGNVCSKASTPSESQRAQAGGFQSVFMSHLDPAAIQTLSALRRHPAGAPARLLSRIELLILLTFHYTTHLPGALSDHLLLFGIRMRASNLSERRQASPWEVFVELMRLFLKPVADVAKHAEGFYNGLRLVALDGTEFSLNNTKDINRKAKKRKSRRGKSAFAKLRCSVMVELIHHNPLAAEVAREGESEWVMSLRLLDRLPEKALLLADRLYGCTAFLVEALKVLRQRCGHFLIRVRSQPKVLEVKRELWDGSRIVVVGVRNTRNRRLFTELIELREIVVKAHRPGGRPVTVRLWTSLLDASAAPALELAKLYMKRWEQELFFRELKHQMRTGALLRSQTFETACQEVASMLLGAAIVAGERAKLQAGQELGCTISFLKTWAYMEPLWAVFAVCGEIITDVQKKEMVKKFMEFISQLRTPKRRARSCPRVVRRPVQRWPRKMRQRERLGDIQMHIIPTSPK